MSAKILSPAAIASVKQEFSKFHTGVDYLILAVLTSHDELDHKYRRSLWFSHGCDTAGLYGDDGEMQCAGEIKDDRRRHPPLDFNRDTILKLEEEIGKMKLTESGIIFKGLNDEPIEAAK